MMFSRHVPVHSKAAKRRCSHSTASFGNAVCGPARDGLSFKIIRLGASGLPWLGVAYTDVGEERKQDAVSFAALDNRMTIIGTLRLVPEQA